MKIGLILALLLLSIASAFSDTTPPKPVSFDFEPKVVDLTKADQNITFTIRLEDDLSGVSDGIGISPSYVRFVSPSGDRDAVVLFRASSGEPVGNNQNDLVLGDMLKGTYVNNVTLPQYGESGEWHIDYFFVVDNVGNSKFIKEQEMIDRGFPTVIEVWINSWLMD